MRVVVDGRYVQDRFPGIGRLAFSLVEALGRLDAGVDFLVPYVAGAGGRLDPRSLAGGNVTLVPVEASPFSLREQVEMPLLARRAGARLWHSPHPAAPAFLPCPRVVHCHDAIPLREPGSVRSPWRRALLPRLLRASLRAAARVITGSEAARSDVVSFLGAAPERTVVVPDGVDARFSPRSAGEAARVRARYGLPGAYALHLSSGKPHKNVDRLLEAWRLAADGGSPGGLVLAVAGEAAAGRAALPGVRFVGEVAEADLPALYSGARLFVFPSLWEGFGLPVLEAMACGTPVACSDTSSLPEVAGDAALLFDPRDPRAMAGAIARLAGDAELRESLRARGLERAARFPWERTARECVAIYREVLSLPRSPLPAVCGASS